MDKQTLRSIIRERKAIVNAKEHRQWSAAICKKLMGNSHVIEAENIMLFYPLPDEPDIRELIATLHRSGKRVLLPEVTGADSMALRVYHGEDSLAAGSLGTQHPTGEVFTQYDKITTAVIPGVAFAPNGNRMGRGKGYYDRFLQNMPTTYLIGVCLPFQLLDQIPVEPTDIVMNEVVTV